MKLCTAGLRQMYLTRHGSIWEDQEGNDLPCKHWCRVAPPADLGWVSRFVPWLQRLIQLGVGEHALPQCKVGPMTVDQYIQSQEPSKRARIAREVAHYIAELAGRIDSQFDSMTKVEVAMNSNCHHGKNWSRMALNKTTGRTFSADATLLLFENLPKHFSWAESCEYLQRNCGGEEIKSPSYYALVHEAKSN